MLTHHRASIMHIEHGAIGAIEVIEIKRDGVGGQFQDFMAGHSIQLGHLARTLFDTKGNLRNIFVDQHFSGSVHEEMLSRQNTFSRGSGCWGSELDGWLTDLFYIDIAKTTLFEGV